MSVKDFIKKSVLESFNFNQAITLSTVLQITISLAVSVGLGFLIYAVYKHFFGGVVFNRSFGVTLVGMTVLTCMVTLAISTNIVISLGMVGALSIVRFRTAIKDPQDLLYLFWGITTGITVGANMYILALAAAFVMIFVLWLMNRNQSRTRTYVLVAHYQGDAAGDAIEMILAKMPHTLKSKTLRGETAELTVDVLVRHENDVFLEKIRAIPQVADVTLIQYNGEYHG
ncbi:MAG: DUF4956 domain-containing protein [Ruthenibacterium sp.]